MLAYSYHPLYNYLIADKFNKGVYAQRALALAGYPPAVVRWGEWGRTNKEQSSFDIEVLHRGDFKIVETVKTFHMYV